MGRPSPKYTAEFKQRAVELYRERGCTYAELARELGCDAGGRSDWVRRADASGAAPDRNPLQMAEEPRGPRREDDRLGTENEMLSKAGALFVCFVNLSFHKTASVRFTRQREDSSRTSVALAPILSSPTTPRA